MSLLINGIRHGWIGDAAGSRFTGAIRIEGDRISEMGDLQPKPGDSVLDASDCVVTPGLINTHHHLFQSVLKGLAMNAALDDWLSAVPYRYWPHIDEQTLRVSARIGLVELLLSGATTVCDHHYLYSQRHDYDPNQVLFEEAERFGVRFVLARGGMTQGRRFGPEVPPPPVETLGEFLDGLRAAASRWHRPLHHDARLENRVGADTISSPSKSARANLPSVPMTQVACAPTTPNFNFSADALPEIASEARSLGLRLHAHLSENEGYAAHTLREYGLRPVPWLANRQWLGEDVWFAHLVDITEDEIRLLAESGTAMAHCPQANARLGSGVAAAPALYRAGGTVSLAVDGAAANEAADMGMALYTSLTLHRAAGGVSAIDPATLLHWASSAGARTLGLPGTGELRPGMAADIALFDHCQPCHFGLHDPALAPLISGTAQVRHSLVAGRLVVRDGRIPGIDLPTLSDDAALVTSLLTCAVRE